MVWEEEARRISIQKSKNTNLKEGRLLEGQSEGQMEVLRDMVIPNPLVQPEAETPEVEESSNRATTNHLAIMIIIKMKYPIKSFLRLRTKVVHLVQIWGRRHSLAQKTLSCISAQVVEEISIRRHWISILAFAQKYLFKREKSSIAKRIESYQLNTSKY